MLYINDSTHSEIRGEDLCVWVVMQSVWGISLFEVGGFNRFCFCESYVDVILALEDDTDRLLDLISRSDELTTPPPPTYSGHHYRLQTTPPPLTYPRSASSSPAKSPSPHVHQHSHPRRHGDGDRRHYEDLQHHHNDRPHHRDNHHHDNLHHNGHRHHANIQRQAKKKLPKIRSPDSPSRNQPARELNYTGEDRHRDDVRYRDIKGVSNFTPAPVITIEKGNPLPSSRQALEQLLSLLQE